MTDLTPPLDDEDDTTEITKADIPRIDAVFGPANGVPFLLLKSEGEQPVDEALVAKAEAADDAVKCPTCKGSGKILDGHRQCPDCGGDGSLSPAEAADLKKGALSAADINDLPDGAFAYIAPGGKKDAEGKTVPRDLRFYPVPDKAHADNAAARAAQAIKAGGDAADIARKAMPKITAAQKKFGTKAALDGPAKKSAEDETPDEPVVKDLEIDVDVTHTPSLDGGDLVAVATPTPLFEGDGEITLQGDEAIHNVPLNNAITSLKTLQTQEIAEPGDETWDVRELNCVLQMVYAWAAGEQSEGVSDLIDDAVNGTVAKAGARLSYASIKAIKTAISALQDLLGPDGDAAPGAAAPTAGAAKKAAAPMEAPVADEDIQTNEVVEKAADPDQTAPVVEETTEEVEKAVATATTDPKQAIADVAAPEGVNKDAVDDDASDEASDQAKRHASPAQASAKADVTQSAPAPVTAEAVTKAVDDAVKASTEAVTKATADMIGDVVKAQMESVLKSALASALEGAVKPLEERLLKVEETPIPNGPFLNGRAQDTPEYLIVQKGQGQSRVDMNQESLMKALGEVQNPKDREKIGKILAESQHPFHHAPQV